MNPVQLSQQLGTSRGTLRAALVRLEEDGLVYTIPYRGTFVTQPDCKTIRELYEVRSVLEVYGIRQAAARCTHDDLERLRRIVADMRVTAAQGEVAPLVRQELQFHRSLIALSGNKLLLDTWSTLQVQIQRVLLVRHNQYPNLEELVDSHLPLLAALERKDADLAAAEIAAHTSQALVDLLACWSPDGPDEPSSQPCKE